MTHDEVMARMKAMEIVDREIATFTLASRDDANLPDLQAWQALKAVLELHKPVQGRSDISTYDYVGCDACVEWSHDGNMNLKYPCPTIQAITDNLK